MRNLNILSFRKCLYPLFVISIALFFVSETSNAQSSKRHSQLIKEMIKLAEYSHVQPVENDSVLACRIAENLVDQIDPSGVLLSIEDIQEINSLQDTIMLALKGDSDALYSSLKKIYLDAIRKSDSCLTKLSETRLSLVKGDSLRISEDSWEFSESNRMAVWTDKMRFYALDQWYNLQKKGKAVTPDELKLMAVDRLKCLFESREFEQGELYQFLQDAFLKSLAAAYDPHTVFMSKDEVALLSRMLSSTDKTFGIVLDQNYKGDIIIGDIVPGSAAWNSNQLNIEDKILSVHQEDSTFLFSCVSMRDAYFYINSPDLDELDFLIEKQDGKEVLVHLAKTKMAVESNRINSFILEGDTKLGYIYLPSFYSNDDVYEYLPNGCANDMAKEIIRLKREGIDALIVDLRNNAGGSMLEAVRSAGMFIDYGALCIEKDRSGDPELLKDLSRGTIFNGPLVVMINNGSASASELFAAALQDYNRAVITGSSSFGKSTSQVVIPIGDIYSQKVDSIVSSGYIKLTTGRFYRVTGDSHQKVGVKPDVFIRDSETGSGYVEKSLPFALDAETIDKESYYRPLEKLPIDSLSLLSEKRLENHSSLKPDNLKSDTVFEMFIPLDTAGYAAYRDKFNDADTVINQEYDLIIKVPEYIRGMSSASGDGEIYQSIIDAMKLDPILMENVNVINDLINILNN